ncbi:hypothetical protein [Faecalibaculum rodentium]|uniref:hypothetical protein n=2 Tax=Faecalibaculum rodentium TaxID=1702221 RepID=UPI0025B74AC6|nr:hypothetical protein [Faecalibaculum rodentium]
MKPSICRTKQRVYIPADEIACKEKEIFIEKVNSINEVTPKAGHAYFDSGGILWGYLNHEFVKLNRHPVSWGELRGNLTDQLDLKLALEKFVKSVTFNGNKLTGENLTIDALTGVKVNGAALEQEDHQVNIDLSDYALAVNIPENVSELTNDSGFITNEQLAESLKGKADKIESIDFCTDADIDAIFTEDK